MKIANIYPIANQHNYKNEQYVMILAHLIDRYDSKNFNAKQYIIMDNGLFEKAQVSTNLQDITDLAENSNIPVKEIIIPDAVNDLERTIELFEASIKTIEKWQHKYRFMFVAQASTYKELSNAISYINQYANKLNLSIGISKLSPLARDSEAAIEVYKKACFPIHFLGIKTTFKEIIPVAKYIRGCDTSQLAFIAKNEETINDVVSYVRSGTDIDLAVDQVSDNTLKKLQKMEKEELSQYGILR